MESFQLIELPHEVGGEKAQRLAWLARNGYRTPPGLVIHPDDENPQAAIAQFLDEVDGSRFIVRSSADGEDGPQHTFAGQYDSVVDLGDARDIAAAVDAVRRSANGARVNAYRGGDGGRVSCVLQPMVPASAGGVVFTRHPVTGLDETIVEAVAGSPGLILAEGREPDRWVHRWGSYTSRPEASLVSEALIDDVVFESRSIAARFGHPLDLEWIWDGQRIWWVQLRPIGLLDIPVYSNRIAREVLPGAIPPLVWSINVPVVNGAWIRLFDEATGPTGLTPDDLARPFAYHAYFNMGTIGDLFAHMGMPRDSLELLLGLPEGPDRPSMKPGGQTMQLLPRMLFFAIRRARGSALVERLLAEVPPELEAIEVADIAVMSTDELWTFVDDLDDIVGSVAEANIVIPLLFNLWTAWLRRLAGDAVLTSVDLDAGMEHQLAEHDPQVWLQRLAQRTDRAAAVAEFVERFGHLSDSGNDISTPTWGESPALIETLFDQASEARARSAGQPWPDFLETQPFARRFGLRWVGEQARRYRIHREAIGSLYTRAYGTYRGLFLELGRRLLAAGSIAAVDDVFFLTRDEVAAPPAECAALAADRRRELEAARGLQLPDTIFGDEFVPGTHREELAGLLSGTAASRGRYTGRAAVITSVAQIDQLRDGDVLVVPFSDVGWTPLFARAGAIVAEAGGLLSHSSIVAREYGIPCVVSVAGATLLRSGTTVTVDGNLGTVEVHE